MITTINLVTIQRLIQIQNKRKRNLFSLVMSTFRIYSLNFCIYHSAVLIIFIMLYIIPLVLIYLTMGNFYLLITFFHFTLPLLPASGNHESGLFFHGFVSEV